LYDLLPTKSLIRESRKLFLINDHYFIYFHINLEYIMRKISHKLVIQHPSIIYYLHLN